MAQRRTGGTSRQTQKVKKQAARLRHTIETILGAAAVLAALVLSLFGGQNGIPTWNEVFGDAGVSSGSPVSRPAATAVPAQPTDGTATTPEGGEALIPEAGGETRIHFIDVGQGDSVLIEQDGEFCLIDCGTERCEDTLLAYLEGLGVETLKLLVMTHPHADHIGSMDAVIRRFQVEQLWMPQLDKAKEYPTTACFEHVLDAVEETNTPMAEAEDGETFAIGTGTLKVLGTGIESDNFNDISLCTMFTAGDFRFVDTGDAEEDVEQSLLQSGQDLSAQLFKAAHHASRTSNSLAFLRAVGPQAVVVSCGEGNTYGHPHEAAMESYEAVNAQVYRTDLEGSIVVCYTAADGMQVYTSRGEQGAAA